MPLKLNNWEISHNRESRYQSHLMDLWFVTNYVYFYLLCMLCLCLCAGTQSIHSIILVFSAFWEGHFAFVKLFFDGWRECAGVTTFDSLGRCVETGWSETLTSGRDIGHLLQACFSLIEIYLLSNINHLMFLTILIK